MTVREGTEGEFCCASDLGAKWRWMVSMTLRPLYPREGDPVPIELGVEGGWVWARSQVDLELLDKFS
jgi:hypothetical protein